MASQSIIITLSDDEFTLPVAEFRALHSVLCDEILNNCIRCREFCCPEGTCGLGGGWIQTYGATYYQPAEHEPACAFCASDDEYGDGDY